jgi:benzoyl-CoA-dihydrodiol lyase
VRRDRADVFSTLAEGLKGKRAKEWGLIDDYFPTSKFQESIDARVARFSKRARARCGTSPSGSSSTRSSLRLNPLSDSGREYKYVKLKVNREQRYADLTCAARKANSRPRRRDSEARRLYWPLQAYRELDDALLHLRVNEPEIGLVCLRTEGDIDDVLAWIKTLAANPRHWLVREIICTWRACCAVSI